MTAGRVVQLAFCTTDLASTVRRYVEGFGFADAGGRILWGRRVAKIQQLGEDTTFALQWLVGRQELVQLEFFQHSVPEQALLPDDWRPSDLGWTRFGIAVPDFDATLSRLGGLGVTTIGEPILHKGLHRASFRDPDLGIIVEILEDGAALPGGIRPRHFALSPAIVYAGCSVADLEAARALYLGAFGLVESEETLHTAEMEGLFSLPGARREGFVASSGEVFLEVSRYLEPVGRPREEGRLLSDQGFMNIAIGYRDGTSLEAAIGRAEALGCTLNAPLPKRPAPATYLTDTEGASVEALCIPREYEAFYGFAPSTLFPPPALWPSTTTPPADG